MRLGRVDPAVCCGLSGNQGLVLCEKLGFPPQHAPPGAGVWGKKGNYCATCNKRTAVGNTE